MSAGRLEADGLELRVGDRLLASGLSFSVAPGDGLAVLGSSGAGKTLLLRRLARLDPGPGRVSLDGQALPATAWRAAVALVPQSPPVFPGTPAELEIALAGLAARDAEPAAPFAEALDVDWDRPFRELSGGERQRVHLALALAGGPRVLLLDEPTSALDAGMVRRVEELVAPLTRVVVTHDPAQAERLCATSVHLGALS